MATLQLEMEFIHGSLEDEVLDIAPESLSKTPNGLLARSGTSDEVGSAPSMRSPVPALLLLPKLLWIQTVRADHANTAGSARAPGGCSGAIAF